MFNVINAMIPKPSPCELIRIGGNSDGAYLVPDDLEGVQACFSPGVCNFKKFEDELATRFGIKSYMCDFSSDVEKFSQPPEKQQPIMVFFSTKREAKKSAEGGSCRL